MLESLQGTPFCKSITTVAGEAPPKRPRVQDFPQEAGVNQPERGVVCEETNTDLPQRIVCNRETMIDRSFVAFLKEIDEYIRSPGTSHLIFLDSGGEPQHCWMEIAYEVVCANGKSNALPPNVVWVEGITVRSNLDNYAKGSIVMTNSVSKKVVKLFERKSVKIVSFLKSPTSFLPESGTDNVSYVSLVFKDKCEWKVDFALTFECFKYFLTHGFAKLLKGNRDRVENLYRLFGGDLYEFKLDPEPSFTPIETYSAVSKAIMDSFGLGEEENKLKSLIDTAVSIEFDTINTPEKDRLPSWIILSNSMNQPQGQAHQVVSDDIGLPTCKSGTLTLIAPSDAVCNDSLDIITQLPLPSFLSKKNETRYYLGDQRWQFAPVTDTSGIPLVQDKIILSAATRTLYGLIHSIASMSLADKLPDDFISSWHLTGMRGTGKSTSLLVCACALFAQPDKYRLAYITNAAYRSSVNETALDMFIKYLSFAFLGDPILTFVERFPYANRQRKVEEDDLLVKYLRVINSYLAGQGLFLVIIADQLNKVSSENNEAMAFFFKNLRTAIVSARFKNILLMTTASMNNEYADDVNTIMIDLLNGFNHTEAKMFSKNFVTSEDRAELMIRDLGVRPIDLNFKFNQNDKYSGLYKTNLTVADINKRGKNFVDGIEEKLEKELKIGDNDRAIAGGIAVIFYVLAGAVGDQSNFDIDKRFLKIMWFPEHTDLAVGDIEDYELALCDSSFRNALKNGSKGLRIFPADNLVRTACVNIFTAFSLRNENLFYEGQFLNIGTYFERLFVSDLIFPTSEQTKKLKLEQHFITDGRIVSSNAPFELDVSSKINYISSDLAVVATDGFEMNQSVSQRLEDFAKDAYLFECRPGYTAADFVLIRNSQVFFIQIAFFSKISGLVEKMLEALSKLEAEGDKLFPILLKGVEPRQINFVFFSSLPPFRKQDYSPRSSATNISRLMTELSAKSNVFNIFLLNLDANKKVFRLCQMLAAKRGLTSPSRDED